MSPKEPIARVSRHLITSALPYINGVKHLGNLVGSMLPADVYARYLRAAENDVLFICATDEHGTPAELAARAAGLDVAEFCAEQHEIVEAGLDVERPADRPGHRRVGHDDRPEAGIGGCVKL